MVLEVLISPSWRLFGVFAMSGLRESSERVSCRVPGLRRFVFNLLLSKTCSPSRLGRRLDSSTSDRNLLRLSSYLLSDLDLPPGHHRHFCSRQTFAYSCVRAPARASPSPPRLTRTAALCALLLQCGVHFTARPLVHPAQTSLCPGCPGQQASVHLLHQTYPSRHLFGLF